MSLIPDLAAIARASGKARPLPGPVRARLSFAPGMFGLIFHPRGRAK